MAAILGREAARLSFPDPPGPEAEDGLVHPLRPGPGEGLQENTESAGEAQDLALQKIQRPHGEEVKAAVSVEEAAGGGLVGLLELLFQTEAANQSRGGGNIVQVPVGALLDGESLYPIGLDVAPGAVSGFQDHHLQPFSKLVGPILQVESGSKATDAPADDNDTFHGLGLRPSG